MQKLRILVEKSNFQKIKSFYRYSTANLPTTLTDFEKKFKFNIKKKFFKKNLYVFEKSLFHLHSTANLIEIGD